MSVGAVEALPVAGTGLAFLDGKGDVAAKSPLQLFWRRFRRDRVALASLAFIAFLIIIAIAAPVVVDVLGLPSPNTQNPNLTDAFGSPLGPSAAHPFGVDQLGQDVMSRVIYGARVSLIVGIVGTGLATIIGVALGVAAGFYRGWVDTALSRITDVVLSIPILLLGLGIGAACAVRGCLGGAIQPGLREILPNLLAPVIVYATMLIPLNILLEAALSFLGVGIRPPTASWGQMIASATPIFNTAWWYMAFPGIALLLTVLAFNLLGDGLQDALNPRTAR